MEKMISCIGSGNMGFALMKGASARIGPENIGFSDIDGSKAAAAAKALGAQVYDSNIQAAEQADYIFLGVKPQVLNSVLDEIAPMLKKRQIIANAPILVSMAPGWTIAKIHSSLGIRLPIVRIMPNTPALISRGVIAMTVSPEVGSAETEELEKLLEEAGMVARLDEKYFDAVTGLSGSGPAFVYLFIEALADGGVRAGLPRDKALHFAAQTVLGSAAMVLETKKHPGELKDMVASPGGTTIAGIAALEKNAFRGTVISAVEAAWHRSAELG